MTRESLGTLMDGAQSAAATELRTPFAIYFGDVREPAFGKTGLGLVQWRRQWCLGQVRREGCAIDAGLPDLEPAKLAQAGVRSLVLGVAPIGGAIPQSWCEDMVAAASAGIDIVSGMHGRLDALPGLAAAARQSGARLVDVRLPPANLPIGSGAKRSGRRLLTVGTDCAVGKKYTALAIEREMQARGWNADFRATGQTGIMIAGSGIPIDAVASDFIAGAAELLSPAADPDHWDVIEGQGALSHPSYAGVSLGLLHGSQPDALVLCHDAARERMLTSGEGMSFPLEKLQQSIDLALTCAQRVNPDVRFVGVSVNSSRIADEERAGLFARYASETGLPVVDPIRDGPGKIVDRIAVEFA